MDINERVDLLRAKMKTKGIDAYIIPSSDPHNSEYVADCWKSREWISGFTGSAGVVVVTHDHAGVWTDSRYFLQAETEITNSYYELHKVYNQFAPMHIKWLIENLKEGSVIGFDGFCFPKSSVISIKKMCVSKNISINADDDLISDIWVDRPQKPSNPIYIHNINFAGMTSSEKVKEIQTELKKQNCDYHFITTLDDLAWIFNIRGNDVECNPVAICYGVIHAAGAILFIHPDKVETSTKTHLENQGVELKSYADVLPYLNNIEESKTILVDPNNCNYYLCRAINAQKVEGPTISRILKARKNKTEINHIRTAMEKDGRALTKAFLWLDKTVKERSVSEFEFSEKLISYRSTQKDYKGESFPAIVGYKGNGAIIHYRPMEDNCHNILNDGMLLCDSGGQYLDGTTDITRTISLSTPTEEEQTNFTLVLKGMIDLTMAKFPVGTSGGQLDVLARQHLWAHGLNYLHGTGHGVGFFLNVHEAPQGFAPGNSARSKTIHEPGMITSNEPGYYKEGSYGIRIENLVLTIESNDPGFLEHETLTLFPIAKNLINKEMLSEVQINWLNRYHSEVYDRLSTDLNEEEKKWLKDKCTSI